MLVLAVAVMPCCCLCRCRRRPVGLGKGCVSSLAMDRGDELGPGSVKGARDGVERRAVNNKRLHDRLVVVGPHRGQDRAVRSCLGSWRGRHDDAWRTRRWGFDESAL